MTIYMTDLTIPDLIRGSSGLITIYPALIAEYFLMGLDNFAISSELLLVWTRESLWDSPNRTTLLDLISTTRKHFLAWCFTAGNKPTMNVLRSRANEEDIPLGLTAMTTYSRKITPSAQAPAKRARRSGKKSRGTPQHKYIPEKHEREGSKFCTFCSNVEGNNHVGYTVFECKDPRCARSRVSKEERFRLGEQEAPASRGSVERGRGGRGRRVHRFEFTGRGGRFRGHKGRGQYRPIYNTNTTEDISSNASPTESKPTRLSTVPHRRINNSNRNSRTCNLPNRVHINAIIHNQSTTDLGNPVNNFPTAQQNLLIPLQIHQTSSDINSIFDINFTVSENHIRSQRSPFLRLKISINDIKMIATIDSAAFCSVITADLAEQCHMSINSKDTIQFLPANNVSTKSLGSATGILSFNVGSIAQQVHYKHTLPLIPVERQHRVILQNLRKILLDFADYDNWSDYLPFCQLVANSTYRKSLNATPYKLIFGSDVSPRLLPFEILQALSPKSDNLDVPEYMTYLANMSTQLLDKWNAELEPELTHIAPPELKFKPEVGSRVFVLRETPNKLHGHYVGPYVVKEVTTRSSLLVENPITRTCLKTSIHLIKFCLSSLPDNILNAYVAADAEELLVDAILDVSDGQATILWSDGTQTTQPETTVKNTTAYHRYIKMMNLDKPRRRGRRKKR
ncbi:hypothetical protein P9112_006357 [Eukaryota sp. TZLM1-RC]